jgi:hypothetical protein
MSVLICAALLIAGLPLTRTAQTRRSATRDVRRVAARDHAALKCRHPLAVICSSAITAPSMFQRAGQTPARSRRTATDKERPALLRRRLQADHQPSPARAGATVLTAPAVPLSLESAAGPGEGCEGGGRARRLVARGGRGRASGHAGPRDGLGDRRIRGPGRYHCCSICSPAPGIRPRARCRC